MCGFAGIVLPQSSSKFRDLYQSAAAMAAALQHRGPDDAGVWVDPTAGVALAHQRLAILDLSVAGHQPMASANGRYVIAFNGEIYNHKELRAQMRDQTPFRTESDCEVIVHLYDEVGTDVASRLDGVDEQLTCSICHELFDDACTLPCGHTFCHGCVHGHFDSVGHACPRCKVPWRRQDITPAATTRGLVRIFARRDEYPS